MFAVTNLPTQRRKLPPTTCRGFFVAIYFTFIDDFALKRCRCFSVNGSQSVCPVLGLVAEFASAPLFCFAYQEGKIYQFTALKDQKNTMQELIQISQLNGVEVVDSRIIAEELGIQHKNLLDTIKIHKSLIESEFGRVAFETLPLKTNGGIQNISIAYLNEDQALFIGTLSRNSEAVVKFKARLVKSFQAARKLQQSQAIAQSTPQTYADALRALAEKVEAEEKLKAEKEKLESENAKLAPRAEYTDKVLASVTDITTTTIAKELGMSAIKLNKILCQEKIQYYQDGHYVLYSKYQSRGYTETRTYQWYDKSGVSHTKHSTVWTERGRALVHSVVNQSLSFNKKKKEVSNG